MAALDVYLGLAYVPAVRGEVIKKVRSMLKHPFPKVRSRAVDILWMITEEEELKVVKV